MPHGNYSGPWINLSRLYFLYTPALLAFSESAWPDSNRRSRASGARGFPNFPTRRSQGASDPLPPRSPTAIRSTRRESNPHVRPGEAAGRRYITGALATDQIVKEQRAQGETRTHVAALRVRYPGRWTTRAC
jgi:hypothetical protein